MITGIQRLGVRRLKVDVDVGNLTQLQIQLPLALKSNNEQVSLSQKYRAKCRFSCANCKQKRCWKNCTNYSWRLSNVWRLLLRVMQAQLLQLHLTMLHDCAELHGMLVVKDLVTHSINGNQRQLASYMITITASMVFILLQYYNLYLGDLAGASPSSGNISLNA